MKRLFYSKLVVRHRLRITALGLKEQVLAQGLNLCLLLAVGLWTRSSTSPAPIKPCKKKKMDINFLGKVTVLFPF